MEYVNRTKTLIYNFFFFEKHRTVELFVGKTLHTYFENRKRELFYVANTVSIKFRGNASFYLSCLLCLLSRYRFTGPPFSATRSFLFVSFFFYPVVRSLFYFVCLSSSVKFDEKFLPLYGSQFVIRSAMNSISRLTRTTLDLARINFSSVPLPIGLGRRFLSTNP